MKRFIAHFIIGAVLIGTFYSCLEIDDTTEPTRGEEQIKLKKYLGDIISKGNDLDTTELGVYYVTMGAGTGAYPKTGDTLTIGYAGYFIDGSLFDASYWHNQTDSTYTFILGNPPLIQGWDDGMKFINKNARVQLIIPSDFAYGSAGSGFIKPFQTLIFVIVMKDIKPSN
jgi:FKBP-type peptidyl-prolyl cis-trans isomerase FkpA